MGTPRRTVPSLSKREGVLRGVLATGIGESGYGGLHESTAEGGGRRSGRRKKE